MKLIKRIHRRLLQLRLKPIRVFCFHQVSDFYDPTTMWECDWTKTEDFKQAILALKKKYIFISLSETHKLLTRDIFRFKRYASLTSDDGWYSIYSILPWLAAQKIPVTLFLNPLYLDGIHFQERDTEKLLKKEDIDVLVSYYSPFISIASHGWSHCDCSLMPLELFKKTVSDAEFYLEGLKGKVPFFAFTFGHFYSEQMDVLLQKGLIPVLMDGKDNINDSSCIHRECIDGCLFTT